MIVGLLIVSFVALSPGPGDNTGVDLMSPGHQHRVPHVPFCVCVCWTHYTCAVPISLMHASLNTGQTTDQTVDLTSDHVRWTVLSGTVSASDVQNSPKWCVAPPRQCLTEDSRKGLTSDGRLADGAIQHHGGCLKCISASRRCGGVGRHNEGAGSSPQARCSCLQLVSHCLRKFVTIGVCRLVGNIDAGKSRRSRRLWGWEDNEGGGRRMGG